MSEQKKMPIELLAEYVPPEARFVAVDESGQCAWFEFEASVPQGARRWSVIEGRWGILVGILLDIDKPWRESLTEIRPPKRWRAAEGKDYWTFGFYRRQQSTEVGHGADTARYDFGNYWRTKEQAKAYADACKALAMKMHDEIERDDE